MTTRANPPTVPISAADSGGLRGGHTPDAAVVRPPRSDAHFIVYMIVALAVLTPGLIGWLYGAIDEATTIGAWHTALMRELQDIRFGSGLRFWLGVAGASLMASLLLYPVRKWLTQRFRLGTIGGWFHIHILFGLIGPMLVLYHCNFGTGGFNANIALYAMLIVTASGILGHFVHTRASADFYAEREQAQVHLDAVTAAVRSLDGQHPGKVELIDTLDAVERHALTPRRGVLRTTGARVTLWHARRHVFGLANDLLRDLAREQQWTPARASQTSHILGGRLSSYFDITGRAASRSIGEQLWARWRLFHLPVFLLMTVAAILHIVAVWGMDGPSTDAAKSDVTAEARPVSPAARIVVAQRKTVSIPMPPPAAAPPPVSPEPEPETSASVLAQLAEMGFAESREEPAKTAAPTSVNAPRQPAATQKATLPKLVEAPRPVPRPVASATPQPEATRTETGIQVVPAPPVATKSAPTKRADDAYKPPEPAAVTPKEPTALAASRVAEAQTPIPDRSGETKEAIEAPPMGLGALKGRSLKEQIAILKQQRFDHAKTRFPLVGKHARVACESCHTKTLEDTPRTCISCHKKDDVHRGRRPTCEKCHVPTDWGDIRRR